MPKVGSKTFPYTKKGKSAAKKAAKKKGMPMEEMDEHMKKMPKKGMK